jgi:formate dehydrogenase major subunit
MGEDPLQTDAELPQCAKALRIWNWSSSGYLHDQTAAAADVILPSTSWGEHEGVFSAADRGFQRFFKAVEPKWDLKTDWQIISEIATRMGYPMHYNNTQEIWDELRHLCPDFYGATYEKMGELGYIQWPCRDTSKPTRDVLSLQREVRHPERPGAVLHLRLGSANRQTHREYPMVLSTVREVGHYSCRSMTGNCAALAALADEPGYAQINTADAERLGIGTKRWCG